MDEPSASQRQRSRTQTQDKPPVSPAFHTPRDMVTCHPPPVGNSLCSTGVKSRPWFTVYVTISLNNDNDNLLEPCF